MTGATPASEPAADRREQIAHAIETLLRTPQGLVGAQRTTGVDYLDPEGRPRVALGPAAVEASAHQALLRDEPRVELDAVTAHFDGNILINIRVAYRDRGDASQHEVTVFYAR